MISPVRLVPCLLLLGSCVLVVRDRPRDARPGPAEAGAPAAIQMIPLEHSIAGQVAVILDALLGGDTGAESPKRRVRFSSDPRTNSLIVLAPAESLPAILDLVQRLDRKLE